MSRKHVTFINDLPDLETLENGYNNNSRTDNFSGTRNPYGSQYNNVGIQGEYQGENPGTDKYIRKHQYNVPPESGMNISSNNYMNDQEYDEPIEMPNSRNIQVFPTCLEIINHVKDCPLCSKFYNNDRTLYIITIIILIIICILLLKKVLNV